MTIGKGFEPKESTAATARQLPTLRKAGTRFNNGLRYVDATDPRNTQFTPSYVLDLVRRDLGGVIDFDPCTTADNPTRARYFLTAEDDGLKQTWGSFISGSIYVNPPYGKAREPWVERCIKAGRLGNRVILLIPAATDTRIFQKAAATATAVVFIKGRVKFGVLRPNRRQVAASHPSALVGWNTDLDACASLGWRTVISTQEHEDDPAAHLLIRFVTKREYETWDVVYRAEPGVDWQVWLSGLKDKRYAEQTKSDCERDHPECEFALVHVQTQETRSWL